MRAGCRRRDAWRSCPSKRMIPPVGRSSSSTIFAVVVLPQPDSPTSPRVLPGSIENEMSSTARTTATWREKMPRFTGKCLTRFLASRTGPAIGLSPSPAFTGADSQQRLVWASATRNSGGASVRQRSMMLGAARVERAARRRRRRVRRLAVDRGEPLAAVAEPRNRLEERLRIRVRGRVVDLLDRAAPRPGVPRTSPPPGRTSWRRCRGCG